MGESMRERPLLLLLSLLLLPLPLTGREKIPLIFPGTFCDIPDHGLCREIKDALQWSIKRGGRFHLVSGRDLKGEVEVSEGDLLDMVFISTLRNFLQEGKVLYKMASFDMAVSTFKKGESYLESIIPFLEGNDELIELKIYTALSFMGAGKEKEARGVLRDLMILDPNFRLNPVRFPPAIIKTFEEVRREVMALPMSSITATSVPRGGEIFLDGKRRGITPLAIGNIPPGKHYVMMRKRGGGRAFQTVEIPPLVEKDIVLTLYPPEFFTEGMMEPDFLKRFLSTFLGVIRGKPNLLLIALVDPENHLRIQILDLRYELLSRAVSVSLTGVEEFKLLMEKVYNHFSAYVDKSGHLREEAGAMSILPIKLSTNRELMRHFFSSTWTESIQAERAGRRGLFRKLWGKGPLYRRWWFWTGAAIVAGGAGTGIYFGVDYYKNPEGSVTINF